MYEDEGHVETDFNVTCPYCLESLWLEFYIQEGQQQEHVIDCEVCCNPILYKVSFIDIQNPQIMAVRLNE